MLTIAKSSSVRALFKLTLIALCALCLLPLFSCASKSGEEGVVDQALKYAKSRVVLDTATSSVVNQLPDATIEVSLLSVGNTSDGLREIKVEPAVVSDAMASWSADEWALNRDDLYFNLAAHFNVICKQAHKFGDIPEDYVVACPDYMVVYDSKKDTGFIVSSTGVYEKTDDPENPIGEAIVVTAQN